MDPVTKKVDGVVVKTMAPNSNKREIKASINQALEKYDSDEKQSVVVLSQGCTKRGVSICTSVRSITDMALFATKGIPLADFLQLAGKLFPKNLNQKHRFALLTLVYK